ncbi:MAG: hypothetical protein WBV84_04025 [Nitrososphaeraceae archaeon]
MNKDHIHTHFARNDAILYGSWTCNDCMTEEKLSTALLNHDDSNSVHHDHMGAANKSDVSPNTPKADEANQ